MPLLKKYHVPASFFIASSFIGSDRLFWWDELTDIILRSPVLPTKLLLNVNQKQFAFELDEAAILTETDHQKLTGWRYYQKPPSKRCILYLLLWKFLRTLIPSEQKAVMCELKKWSGCFQAPDYAEKLPMSVSQLQELERDPLFTVGLHTFNHIAMGLHSPILQEKEIAENRSHLTKILKKDADMIAFPHGSYNNDSIQLVKKLGLRACLTSKKFIVTKTSDNYELGRYSVREWEGTSLKNRLDSWFWKAET
jgi:peptidoglycan/xylan/chitin deacetylase (PgdA/CDA1 family)